MRVRLFARVWVHGVAEVTFAPEGGLSKFINSEERSRMMNWREWKSSGGGWYRRGMSLLLRRLTPLDVVDGINWNKLVFARNSFFFRCLYLNFFSIIFTLSVHLLAL